MKKLILILGTVGCSLSAVFVRYSNAPSMVMVLYRMFFSVILLLPMLWSHREELKALDLRTMGLCILSGVLLAMHFTCYFESLDHIGIAMSVILTDTEVFFVAILGLVLLKQKIGLKGWIGITVTFLGACIIAGGSRGGNNALSGSLLAVSAAILMSGYTIIGTVCRRKISATVYTYLVYLSAFVTVLALVLIRGVPVLGYGKINILMGLGLAVFPTLLGHSIFSWCLKYMPAAYVSMAKLLEPIYSAILGVVLFDEIPTMAVIIGGVAVIAGIVFYTLSTETEKKAEE